MDAILVFGGRIRLEVALVKMPPTRGQIRRGRAERPPGGTSGNGLRNHLRRRYSLRKLRESSNIIVISSIVADRSWLIMQIVMFNARRGVID